MTDLVQFLLGAALIAGAAAAAGFLIWLAVRRPHTDLPASAAVAAADGPPTVPARRPGESHLAWLARTDQPLPADLTADLATLPLTSEDIR